MNKKTLVLICVLIISLICISYKIEKKIFNNNTLLEKIDDANKASIIMNTSIGINPKKLEIKDEEDINELKNIFKTAKISKNLKAASEKDYYMPTVSFLSKTNDKIMEISIYDVDITIDGNLISLSESKREKAKEIIKKYIKDVYGVVTCQEGTTKNTYYLYDNNIIKYVSEVKDITENANINSLKKEITKSDNYNIFLIYNGQIYGSPYDKTVTLDDGYYLLSKTYLIDKMSELELKELLNMSKKEFENQKVSDIENKYPSGTCKLITIN